MIVLTGASKSYAASTDRLMRSVLEHGYMPRIFDLGGLNLGKPMHVPPVPAVNGYQPKSPFKPDLILAALLDCECMLTAYMDADTCLRRPIYEVTGDYDVGVTIFKNIRPEEHIYPEVTAYLNAGVLFLYKGARVFVEQWRDNLRYTRTGSDQEALTRLLLRYSPQWKVGETFFAAGARVKFFDADIYNSISLLPEAAIWHWHGDKQRDLIKGVA